MPVRLITSSVGLVLVLVAGCDVEVSLGRGDAGLDALAIDAPHVEVDAPALDAPEADVAHAVDAPDDSPPDARHCAAPDAGVCEGCVAAACCDALLTCHGTTNCECIVACVLAGDGTRAECSTHCGADGGEHAVVLDCAHDACTTSCP